MNLIMFISIFQGTVLTRYKVQYKALKVFEKALNFVLTNVYEAYRLQGKQADCIRVAAYKFAFTIIGIPRDCVLKAPSYLRRLA